MSLVTYRVSGPRWTFAIDARNGIVVDAAPIAAKSIGRPVAGVLEWWRGKGADSIEPVRVGPRLVVTGGRDFSDRETVSRVLGAIRPSELAHGGARGLDTLAGEWATARGVPCAVYRADWDRLGKAAGHERNGRMLRDFRPDLVVAFPGGRGTANCTAQALGLGILVRRVDVVTRRLVVVSAA